VVIRGEEAEPRDRSASPFLRFPNPAAVSRAADGLSWPRPVEGDDPAMPETTIAPRAPSPALVAPMRPTSRSSPEEWEDGHHLDEVAQRRRFSNGWALFALKKPRVGAQHLDASCEATGHGDDLLQALQRRHFLVREQVLQHSLGDEEQRVEEGDGKQHVDGRAIRSPRSCRSSCRRRRPALRVRPRAMTSATAIPRGGGEVVPRQAGHLREVADGGLRHVRLPVVLVVKLGRC